MGKVGAKLEWLPTIWFTDQYLSCFTRIKNIYSEKESLVLRYDDIKNNLIISVV